MRSKCGVVIKELSLMILFIGILAFLIIYLPTPFRNDKE